MRRVLPALLLLVIACGGQAKPAPAPPPITIDEAHLDAQLTAFVESHGRRWGETRKLSGFVLVAQHDQPVYARGFGLADRERGAAPTADTSFRIGSVTKQFTAAAILVLEQDGKLSVDDPIRAHLPEYPAVGAGVTIHQLLTHTSGISSYTSIPAVMETRARPRTVAELLATFSSLPLEFAPGERFAYSNSNYAVLGAIVERVSGRSYGEFVRTRLFEPAGMTRTVYGDAAGDADRAIGYEPSGDALAPAPAIDMSTPFAAGGVRSTANDLVRWHRALEGDAILGAAAKAKLYRPEQNGYAYGWGIGEEHGHRVIRHGGGIDGFTSAYLRVPDLDLVVVAWSNNGGLDVGAIGQGALTAALGGTLEPVDEPERIALDPAIGARIAATYALTDAARERIVAAGAPAEVIDSIATVTLRVDGGQLLMKPAGQPELPLTPTAPTTFLFVEAGVTVDVTVPAEGPATALRITQGGLTLEYAAQ